MKVSINWLKNLVKLKVSIKEVVRLLPLRTIGTKEVTDGFIELDMKGYNRADLLSMRGVAREIAAITDSNITFTDQYDFVWEKQDIKSLKVEVKSKQAPVYCLAKIEGIRPEKSPKEWVEKLQSCGMRSVNAVTDITNLVMLEYGQPLHAFDATKVIDETIIVSGAEKEEQLTTLDNKKRVVLTGDLVIADPEKVIGIAGVMGCLNTEVTDATTTILLEAAIFDSATLRKTATRLGLQSEASKRFIHGLTRTNLFQAFSRAIQNYQKLGGTLTGIYLSDRQLDKPRHVLLDLNKVSGLIGITIPPEQVKKYLTKLNYQLASQDNVLRVWEVTVPYWRLDINIEEDLIEEIARMYGYDRIPAKPLEEVTPTKIDQSLFDIISGLKMAFSKAGLTEVQTYSFYSTAILDTISANLGELVKIANPISSETEYLRDNLWPNLLEVTSKNFRQGLSDIAIFEIGKIYKTQEKRGLIEIYRLSLVLLNGSDNPRAELYQIFKKAADMLKIDLSLEEAKNTDPSQRFHPIRFSHLLDGDEITGTLAEIHPRVVNKLGLEKRVAVVELDIQKLL